MMKNDYALLVNSCDMYSDVWPYFFRMLKKMWKGDFPQIYLNTETKVFQYEDLHIVCLHSKKQKWGERLLEALSEIKNDYILMVLDDFLFEKEINVDSIDTCLNYLCAHRKIVSFQMIATFNEPANNQTQNEFPLFVKKKKFSKFILTTEPTLWRRQDLMAFVNKNDTPWGWEYFGSYRAWFSNKYFYKIADVKDNIFQYDSEHGGAIHRGKWVGYKIQELSEKYNFEFNAGNREVEYDWTVNQEPKKRKIKRVFSILKNRSLIVVNLIYGLLIRVKK